VNACTALLLALRCKLQYTSSLTGLPFAGGANKASGGVGNGAGAAMGAGATGAAAQVTP